MAGNSEANSTLVREVRSTERRVNIAAVISVVVSIIAAGFTGGTFLTNRQALHANERAALQTQRTTLFSQFQQQYGAVSASFPHGYLNPKFRPAYGTDDYGRLQAYWFFCFSEWYATHRVNQEAFGDLWAQYYSPLIADGLKVQSLRYVLEDRIRSRGVGNGDWTAFLRELGRIARDHGEPLSTNAQMKIDGNERAELNPTEVRFASSKRNSTTP